MIGVPFENMDLVFETVELNVAIEPDAIQLSIFYPYRNTTSYNLCEKEGLLTDQEALDYLQESVLNLPGLSPINIAFFNRLFHRLDWFFKLLWKSPPPLSTILLGSAKRILRYSALQIAIIWMWKIIRPLKRIIRNGFVTIKGL